MEAIERELDAIAVQIMEESGQEVHRAPPPASKKVVAALPIESLTAERLLDLGGAGVRCPVCMVSERWSACRQAGMQPQGRSWLGLLCAAVPPIAPPLALLAASRRSLPAATKCKSCPAAAGTSSTHPA